MQTRLLLVVRKLICERRRSCWRWRELNVRLVGNRQNVAISVTSCIRLTSTICTTTLYGNQLVV